MSPAVPSSSHHPVSEQTVRELNRQLVKLDRRLRRRVSVRFNLAMAVAQGAAAAIGATIVAGILVAWLARSVRTIEDVPVLNLLITPELKEAIDTNYPETK
ncbi:MAG: hypothetical protein COU69_03135 [Candidatus Pacebacteria bacterium CG10_big_fil_rev_8_21_14_0_10_56_10]|nr:MAG: hypothetical protein COU69_03135 [Candidatus Pacebacteria bacterium CG10_big_fil_rev_8_21_14_0_10_56_10]